MKTIIQASRVDVTNIDVTFNATCDSFDCTCQGCVWDG